MFLRGYLGYSLIILIFSVFINESFAQSAYRPNIGLQRYADSVRNIMGKILGEPDSCTAIHYFSNNDTDDIWKLFSSAGNAGKYIFTDLTTSRSGISLIKFGSWDFAVQLESNDVKPGNFSGCAILITDGPVIRTFSPPFAVFKRHLGRKLHFHFGTADSTTIRNALENEMIIIDEAKDQLIHYCPQSGWRMFSHWSTIDDCDEGIGLINFDGRRVLIGLFA